MVRELSLAIQIYTTYPHRTPRPPEHIGSDTFNSLYHHYDTSAEFDRREEAPTKRAGSAVAG